MLVERLRFNAEAFDKAVAPCVWRDTRTEQSERQSVVPENKKRKETARNTCSLAVSGTRHRDDVTEMLRRMLTRRVVCMNRGKCLRGWAL